MTYEVLFSETCCSGPLPVEFANLVKLCKLYLNGNELTGACSGFVEKGFVANTVGGICVALQLIYLGVMCRSLSTPSAPVFSIEGLELVGALIVPRQ